MDLSSMSVFQTASQRMHHLSVRQEVISENIANSDTPGYEARDVQSFSDYVSGARTHGLAATNPRHISSGRAGDVAVEEVNSWGTSPNGNSVILEEETIKSADTADNYMLASMIYSKANSMLRSAISGRG
ncbi:flagellar basal body protein [Salipiger sp. PrR003]|uniref:flagellar basal body rod protein FlgB n=1 Tax=Salipiger sp. PrR003 TaxID=2706776 RepID=UPI0013DCC77A|nr:flagellar basal body protein [Salipiger sp. PrR003]NDV50811.1 flagellar biosynthesis protein FlgB [Salipiger sp. PrR003]